MVVWYCGCEWGWRKICYFFVWLYFNHSFNSHGTYILMLQTMVCKKLGKAALPTSHDWRTILPLENLCQINPQIRASSISSTNITAPVSLSFIYAPQQLQQHISLLSFRVLVAEKRVKTFTVDLWARQQDPWVLGIKPCFLCNWNGINIRYEGWWWVSVII